MVDRHQLGASGDSNSGDDHHSYTHWDGDNVPHFMNWYAERMAELLDTMKGGTANLLDQSVVGVGMEFGRNHNASDMPVMLFGSLGGYLQRREGRTN